jgi:rhamnogalacturonan endolyase
MLKGSSGFYCYAILEHASGWPALSIAEARLAFKLNTAKYRIHQPLLDYLCS